MDDDSQSRGGDSFWELTSQNEGEDQDWSDSRSEISALSGTYSQAEASAATDLDVCCSFFEC